MVLVLGDIRMHCRVLQSAAFLVFWLPICTLHSLQAQSAPDARSDERSGSSAAQSVDAITAYDRPTGPIRQSRSVVNAKKAMACTSDPRATQAAIEVLRQGGSAVDAAIAANAVLGVVEPMSCGIGGDLYCIGWDAKSQLIYGLNASGRSPLKLNRQLFEQQGLEEIPTYGPLAWSVPGCVAGWQELHQKYGRLPVSSVLQPAIDLAEGGFAVAPLISAYWGTAAKGLRQHPDTARTYLPNGMPPKSGQVFRNPNLAATYRRLAKSGLETFYHGEIAQELVRFSQSNGGYFTAEDFSGHRNEWVPPISTNYRGFDVWQIPPNGQGLSVLQILNVLNQFDVRAMGWGSPEYAHLLIEAKKLAYADRARFYADMAFEQVPVQSLNSMDYATRQAARIDFARSAMNVEPGDPKLRDGDTVYLCVVDADRNCCSLIQSNYHGFGSFMVPGNLGFVLQNRGNLFALDAEHPNRLEPGKRPFHTIIPSMVTKNGQPVFVFGVMGGDMQPQGQVQVLVNWLDFDMNIQMAGDASRIRHDGSATPTGLPEHPPGGVVRVESTLPSATIEQLRAMGHSVETARTSMGGYQGILIDYEQGTLQGATESRNDGLALGLD